MRFGSTDRMKWVLTICLMNFLLLPVASLAFFMNLEKWRSKLSVCLNLAIDKQSHVAFFWSKGTNNFLTSCWTWNHDPSVAMSALDLNRSSASFRRHDRNCEIGYISSATYAFTTALKSLRKAKKSLFRLYLPNESDGSHPIFGRATNWLVS